MSEPQIKVLLIEDDEDDFFLTRELLYDIDPERLKLDWVSSYEAGLARIAERAHDVYLIDYRIGANTGLDLLAEARRRGCRAPLILLTGDGDREIDIAAMHAGAADYLVKGQISAPLLERSIRYSIERARNLEVLRERESQLLQSQKMEAIGRLAGGVAHDFNNLLTAITGYSDLLLGRLDAQSPLEGDVLEIKKAAERATALTRQLLMFSRKQLVEHKVLDLNTVVTELEPMLRRIIGEDVTLLVQTDAAVPATVFADPGQMEQIVLNLAINARDAMPSGGGLTIKVSVESARGRQSDAAGLKPERGGMPSDSVVYMPRPNQPAPTMNKARNYVHLSVRDTGVGMTPQLMEHIFEPFYTTKQPGKGTGLGLSTIYAIVQQCGGQVMVRSIPAHGSQFDVYLPQSTGPVEPQNQAVLQHNEPAPEATILLVEDQPLVRKLIRRLLQVDGYKVLEAGHGEDAMELSAAFADSIDLLITDIVMPRISGDQLAAKLVKQRPTMRVLYVSGYADFEVFSEALQPHEYFLQKPFSPAELASKVCEILSYI